MSGNSLKYILILCFMWSQLTLSAQETRKIDGQRYQVHVVEKGHTLFAISKKYSIAIDQIILHNPGAKDGLSIGEEILIPLSEIDKKAARDNPPEMDGQYLEHLVERKETLFSISKRYNVEINSILEHNPEAQEGLKPGQKLRIFVGDIPVKNQEVIVPAQKDSLVLHKVKPKETLYAISRIYNVSIDSLRTLNEGVEESLREGSVIRIPRYTEEYLTGRDSLSTDDVYPELSGTRTSYHVALMLPFSTEIQDSLSAGPNMSGDMRIYTLTRIAAEMYRGVLMAADSLVNSGLNLDLHVYDVSDDLIALDDLLKKPEMKTMHLIIGPLHRESYEMVSKFAAPLGIQVVAPVPNQKLNTQYRGSCIVHSNALEQIRFLGRYVSRMHFTNNVVLVDSDKFTDYDFVHAFLGSYQTPYGKEDTIRAVKLEKYGIESVKRQLVKNGKNIIVVPSSDLGFVSDFMNRLSNIDRDFDIQVIGMEKWLDYENIDMQYKNRFKVTVPSATFLDFESPATEAFIERYRNAYEQEPASDGYAFLGFDVAYYFMNALKKYGLDFPRHYADLKHQGIHVGFDFQQQSTGTLNKHIYLLQFDDYRLKRLN